MKNIFRSIGLSALVISSSYSAPSYAENESDFSSPESVLHYNDQLFVSNVGKKLEPTALDGDGYISLLKLNGDVISKNLFDITFNAPKGMSAHNNVLYVADINRVIGIDIKSKKQVFEVSLENYKVNFLNDIAVNENGILYVSGTDTGDIYQINTNFENKDEAVSRLPLDNKLPGPNGLFYDQKSNTLWVVSFGVGETKKGEVGKIDLSSYKYKKVSNMHGMFDGIALISDSKVILSDWVAFDKSGKIIELDIETGKQTILFKKIGGPADFAYLSKSKQIVIPKMIENKISIQQVQ